MSRSIETAQLLALGIAVAACSNGTPLPTDAGTPAADVGADASRSADANDASDASACDPVPIAIGTHLTIDPAQVGEHSVGPCGDRTHCPGYGSIWRYYALTVAAGGEVNVIMVPAIDEGFTQLHPTVAIMDSCDGPTCIDATAWQWEVPRSPPMSTVSVVQPIRNESASARRYVVAVGICDLKDSGAYTLSVDDAATPIVSLGGPCDPAGVPLDCAPPGTCVEPSLGAICQGPDLNGDCAAVRPEWELGDLVGAAEVIDGIATALGSASDTRCDAAFSGRQHYYRLAAWGGVRIRVTPSPDLRPILRILDSCAATTCFASIAAPAEGAAIEYVIPDLGGVARMFSVGASDLAHDGTYSLTIEQL